MESSKKILRKNWSTSFPSSFRIDLEEGLVRTFQIDIDGDGNKEYCIQSGLDLFVLKDNNLETKEEDLIILPLNNYFADDDICIGVRGSEVSLMKNNNTKWEKDISRTLFGVGFGRDYDDEFEFGRRYLGLYKEKLKILTMEPAQLLENSDPVIFIFTSNGRLLALNLLGEVLYKRQLMKGYFIKARIFPRRVGDKLKIFVSANCHYKRMMHFKQTLVFDWHTFELEVQKGELKLIQTYQKLGILGSCPNTDDEFVDMEFKRIKKDKGKLIKEDDDCDMSFLNQGQTRSLATDPSNPQRALLISYDSTENSIIAKSLNGTSLWEQKLDTEGTVQKMSAVLGIENSPSERMLALFYETSRKIDGLAAENKEFHIRIYYEEGTKIKEFDYPMDTLMHADPDLILDDVNNDGYLELVVIGSEELTVFDLGRTFHKNESLPEISQKRPWLPDFFLPSENLWTLDFVQLTIESE